MDPTVCHLTTAAPVGGNRSPTPHPRLLRIPTWYSELARDEVVLPLPAADYDIQQVGDRWRVTVGGTNEMVYAGIGPVEVVRSRAPI